MVQTAIIMSFLANLLKYNKCGEIAKIIDRIKDARSPILSFSNIGVNTKIVPKIADNNLRVKSLSPNKKKTDPFAINQNIPCIKGL